MDGCTELEGAEIRNLGLRWWGSLWGWVWVGGVSGAGVSELMYVFLGVVFSFLE